MSRSPPAKRRRAVLPQQQNDDTNGTIVFAVDRVSTMTRDEIRSIRKEIGGFPWRFEVERSLGDEHRETEFLACHIYCEQADRSNVWFCDCSVTIVLMNMDASGVHKKKGYEQRCDSTDPYSGDGFPEFMKWEELIDPAHGFIKEDCIHFEVEITVKSLSGKRFRSKVEYDFFVPSEKSDGILVVEDVQFHVSKQLLATYSSYFEKLFFKDYKEKKKNKIVIQEVSSKDFEALLRKLYRMDQSFKIKNVEPILKLADMFDVTSVIDDAERYLISNEAIKIEVKLLLADKYRLHTLYDHLMNLITSCHMIKDLKATDEYQGLKAETKLMLFDMYTLLCECEEGSD